MNDITEYQLTDPAQLLTPCLLVYPKLIRDNLQESIRIAGNVERLRPHVKTHKTSQIVEMELEAGISKHKCATLSEAQMLAECGAPDVLIAYQQVGPGIRKLAEIVATFPKTQFQGIVEDLPSALALEQHFASKHLQLDVLMDIDTGMHRTGIAAGKAAAELYHFLRKSTTLRAAGLHVYDGQNHQSDPEERQAAVENLMKPILNLVRELTSAGAPVPKLVCGGTPTFPIFAQLELQNVETTIECSPGTCVLSDYNYGKDYQDLSCMQHAAVLMTRVISKQHKNRLTVDLGNKAVAADPPAGSRCHFLDLPDAKELKHNEEHLMLETTSADAYQVGDVLYALPAHICPTVALHCELQVVENGQVIDRWKVSARDRLYR